MLLYLRVENHSWTIGHTRFTISHLFALSTNLISVDKSCSSSQEIPLWNMLLLIYKLCMGTFSSALFSIAYRSSTGLWNCRNAPSPEISRISYSIFLLQCIVLITTNQQRWSFTEFTGFEKPIKRVFGYFEIFEPSKASGAVFTKYFYHTWIIYWINDFIT